MRVGVPIISTNEGELLRHTLPLVLAQEDVDVVVFDNASTDSTADVAADLGVRYVRFDERHSFGRAMNAAVRTMDTEAVLFVQPDCFVSPDMVATAAAHLDDPTVGSVAPKLIRTEGPAPGQRLDVIDAAGMVAGPPAQERPGGPRPARAGLRHRGRGVRRRRGGRAVPARGAGGLPPWTARCSTRTWSCSGRRDWASDVDLAWRVAPAGLAVRLRAGAVAYHVRTLQPVDPGRMPEWTADVSSATAT